MIKHIWRCYYQKNIKLSIEIVIEIFKKMRKGLKKSMTKEKNHSEPKKTSKHCILTTRKEIITFVRSKKDSMYSICLWIICPIFSK